MTTPYSLRLVKRKMSAEVEAETQQEDVQQEYSGSGSKDWPPSVGGDGGGEELSGGEDSSDTSSGSTSEEGEEEEEETDSSKGSKDKSAEGKHWVLH